MRLFYIDDSGNTGARLDSPTEPIHWLVALAVTPAGVKQIEAEALGVALKYFKARAFAADFELHGGDLFGGRGDARALAPAERILVLKEVFALVGRFGAKIWVRGIHKQRHGKRASEKGYAPEHPYKLAFMYLVESLDGWLSSIQPAGDLLERESKGVYGLHISDEQAEVGRDLVAGFARWRQSGTDHGYRTRDIKFLIDTVHYVPSHDSWLIQLVDCIAFIRNRLEKIRTQKGVDPTSYHASDAAVARLWTDFLQPNVADERIWPGS